MNGRPPANVTLMGFVPARSVLVVEDAAAMRLLIGHILTQAGHQTVLVGSVKEAMEVLDTRRVDVVVTDLTLPGLGGLDLLQAMKSQADSPPVIVVTAEGEDAMRERALELGASAFLTKPFSRYELLDAVFLSDAPG